VCKMRRRPTEPNAPRPVDLPKVRAMTALTVEESRAQFEAAMYCHSSFFKRDKWGDYEQTDIHYRWLGWELHRRTVSEGER
jgi:hypothetical protein